MCKLGLQVQPIDRYCTEAMEGLIGSGRHRTLFLCKPVRHTSQLSRGLVETAEVRGFGTVGCKGPRHFETLA